MRNSDSIFFIVLWAAIGLAIMSALNLPIYIFKVLNIEISKEYYQFWWILLVPLAIIKVWLPKSRIGKWLNS